MLERLRRFRSMQLCALAVLGSTACTIVEIRSTDSVAIHAYPGFVEIRTPEHSVIISKSQTLGIASTQNGVAVGLLTKTEVLQPLDGRSRAVVLVSESTGMNKTQCRLLGSTFPVDELCVIKEGEKK